MRVCLVFAERLRWHDTHNMVICAEIYHFMQSPKENISLTVVPQNMYVRNTSIINNNICKNKSICIYCEHVCSLSGAMQLVVGSAF